MEGLVCRVSNTLALTLAFVVSLVSFVRSQSYSVKLGTHNQVIHHVFW